MRVDREGPFRELAVAGIIGPPRSVTNK